MMGENMNDEELQKRLKILFKLIEEGRMKFSSNTPETLNAIKKVKRFPDGSFDLSTVDSPVRALCNTIDSIENIENQNDNYERELPEINLPELNKERINEDQFMEDIINASNIVNKYLIIVAGIYPTKNLDSVYFGVIMGHMVRLFKLYDSFLYLIVGMRGEVANIILRCIVDTGITLSFLLKEDDPEVIEKYIKSSLVIEKKLWDEIHRRKGETLLPIEKRMLDSIKATFERSGTEIDSVTAKDMKWCGSLYDKAQKTDMVSLYESIFRGGSHSVHGTWHDLEFNHIHKINESYEPIIEYTRPRPQLVESASIICLKVATEYLNKILDENNAKLVRDQLILLMQWFLGLQEAHENWIQTQK